MNTKRSLDEYLNEIHINLLEGLGVKDEYKRKTFSDTEVLAINKLKEKIKYMLHIGDGDGWMKTPGIIIAGGCFTSLLLSEKPKDIDIFILDDESADFHARLIIEQSNMLWFKDMDNKEKQSYIDSINHRQKDNANIKDFISVDLHGLRCQFIFTEYKTREELIDHFDFVHTKVSYDIGKDCLYISKETFDAIILKKLVIANPVRGVVSWRLDKFKRRNWNMWSIPDEYKTGIL